MTIFKHLTPNLPLTNSTPNYPKSDISKSSHIWYHLKENSRKIIFKSSINLLSQYLIKQSTYSLKEHCHYFNTVIFSTIYLQSHILNHICTESYSQPYMYTVIFSTIYVHSHTLNHICTQSYSQPYMYTVIFSTIYVHSHTLNHICTESYSQPYMYTVIFSTIYVQSH